VLYGRIPLSATIVNPGREAITGELVGTIEFRPTVDELPRFYRQEVEFTDRQIGRLIAALRSTGVWEDSLVVFVADHGEGLGDSGRFGHVDHLSNDTLRVPLVLAAPGRLTPGKVVSTSVRLIDVLPTVLEMLEVDPPSGMMGETLLSLLEDPGRDRPLVAMTFRPQAKLDRRALVANGFKYIWSSEDKERQLFDLAEDPSELDNLALQEPELAEAMHEELLRALTDGRAERIAQPAELSQEEIEGLEALGYRQ
jgi:arylsulfatase A-like enzyme